MPLTGRDGRIKASVMHGEKRMATDGHMMQSSGGSRRTLIIWGGAAGLLLLPFIAMRFTSEVNWGAADFLVMGIMLAVVCGIVELVVRLSGSWAYRLGAFAAIGSAFLITWTNLAVGIVGSEDNPANRLYFGALLVGLMGAAIARFRARGMALAMTAAAVAVGLAFLAAVSGPTDEPNVSHWLELIATAIIVSPLLLSAWLFRKAAQ
jgi:hypothetical protein